MPDFFLFLLILLSFHYEFAKRSLTIHLIISKTFYLIFIIIFSAYIISDGAGAGSEAFSGFWGARARVQPGREQAARPS